MIKPKIAIASVLKPLHDARSFYRLGLSLRETNKYHLNIIGFSLKNVPREEDIDFFTLFGSNRDNPRRLFVSINFISILKKIKPKVLIITTYELLPAAVLMKFFLKYRLVYDVQENYKLNIKENKTISGWKKWLAISWVGFVQNISKPFIDKYIFAEACYQEEMPTIKNFVVLENKFFGKIKKIQTVKFAADKPLTFLISGTLTEVYGTIDAILWFGELVKYNPNYKLNIIGHVTIDDYGKKIEEIASKIPQIRLEISPSPIDYKKILRSYDDCDIVLLPYHQLPSIHPKIPSKLYESLAMGKPFVFSSNMNWEMIAKRYGAGQSVNFFELEYAKMEIEKILKQEFYSHGMDKFPYWKSKEEEKLQELLNYLSKN
ncbi:glycosyltransferase [Belliella sp. R4-6]|uniref:Glycosyltransferase n=1 Tax=Belliella alkalica TaxID=1730871 RepID=A0ABS9V7E9_9BACT|nr:glycosyltransferase [Belliella alkalica]MCH7411880.1 glycosyltransferase [Belliella alkalica]